MVRGMRRVTRAIVVKAAVLLNLNRVGARNVPPRSLGKTPWHHSYVIGTPLAGVRSSPPESSTRTWAGPTV